MQWKRYRDDKSQLLVILQDCYIAQHNGKLKSGRCNSICKPYKAALLLRITGELLFDFMGNDFASEILKPFVTVKQIISLLNSPCYHSIATINKIISRTLRTNPFIKLKCWLSSKVNSLELMATETIANICIQNHIRMMKCVTLSCLLR